MLCTWVRNIAHDHYRMEFKYINKTIQFDFLVEKDTIENLQREFIADFNLLFNRHPTPEDIEAFRKMKQYFPRRVGRFYVYNRPCGG